MKVKKNHLVWLVFAKKPPPFAKHREHIDLFTEDPRFAELSNVFRGFAEGFLGNRTPGSFCFKASMVAFCGRNFFFWTSAVLDDIPRNEVPLVFFFGPIRGEEISPENPNFFFFYTQSPQKKLDKRILTFSKKKKKTSFPIHHFFGSSPLPSRKSNPFLRPLPRRGGGVFSSLPCRLTPHPKKRKTGWPSWGVWKIKV